MADSISSISGSTSGISFSGVSSGIDTQSIIDALTNLESRPINAAKAKVTKLTSLQGQITQLSTRLKALRDKAASLSTVAQGLSLSVTSSDTSKVTASASASAATGPHTLEISQLAQAASSYLSGPSKITDPAAASTDTGNLTITYAGTATAVDVTGLSLNAIRDAINTNVTGVSATVVNAGTSASPDYRIVLNGAESGATKTLTVTADAGVSLTNTTVLGAQNAIFKFDGIAGIERETNTVTDYLPEVTFNLIAATETGKPVSLNITTDVSGVKDKIKAFVTAYNDVVSYYNTNNTYNSATKVAGSFFGDSTVGGLISNLRQLGFKGGSEYVSKETDTYGSLSSIGIALQSDGTLQIDDAKLTSRISTSAAKTLDLFADSDGSGTDLGIAIEIRNFAQYATTGGTVNSETGAFVGVLDSKVASIKDQLASLQKTIDTGEDHVAQYTAQLKAKYSKFEEVIGKLKAQQAALAAKFG